MKFRMLLLSFSIFLPSIAFSANELEEASFSNFPTIKFEVKCKFLGTGSESCAGKCKEFISAKKPELEKSFEVVNTMCAFETYQIYPHPAFPGVEAPPAETHQRMMASFTVFPKSK